MSEIENKITNDHHHDKYITTQEFSKLTSENFTAGLKQANLASESDIANFVKKTDLNKNELNEQKKATTISNKGLTKDLINKFCILNVAKYFSSGIFQNLVFIPAKKNTLNLLVSLLRLIRGNLMQYQKKILKI